MRMMGKKGEKEAKETCIIHQIQAWRMRRMFVMINSSPSLTLTHTHTHTHTHTFTDMITFVSNLLLTVLS